MKEFRSLLLGMFLICLSLCLSVETTHAEVTYLGEFCAIASQSPCTMGAPCMGPIVIKLGVLFYGDGHYALNGTSNSSPVYGTGFIQDNIATISLNETMSTSASAIHMVLDLNTGTGTYTEMTTFPVLTPPDTSGVTLLLIGGFCPL